MNKTIPVVYCFDKSYAKYAAVSTHSLFLNSNSKLTVYWVVPDCDVHEVDELSKLLKIRGISITVLGVSDDYSVGRGGHAYISQAAYLRIAIPYVVMEEKIIYIDSDTLILADLMELYNHEMYDKQIGGVIDLWRGGGSKIPLEDGDPYINSGVMLMNLSALRAGNFFERCRSVYKCYHEYISSMDQCIINKYAENSKIILNKKWNVQILSNQAKWTELKNGEVTSADHAIVHFLGAVKPWEDWCDPLISDFWWGYANNLEELCINSKKISNIKNALIFLVWIRSNKIRNSFRYFKKFNNLKLKHIIALLFIIPYKFFNQLFRVIVNLMRNKHFDSIS